MFDFYKLFYPNYLSLEELKEACKWKVLSEEEFKNITGQDYVEAVTQ